MYVNKEQFQALEAEFTSRLNLGGLPAGFGPLVVGGLGREITPLRAVWNEESQFLNLMYVVSGDAGFGKLQVIYQHFIDQLDGADGEELPTLGVSYMPGDGERIPVWTISLDASKRGIAYYSTQLKQRRAA